MRSLAWTPWQVGGRLALLAVLVGAAVACAPRSTAGGDQTPPPDGPRRAAVETVLVRDAQLERQFAQLQLRVFEKDAQVEDLQRKLDDAIQEVVRAMAKLQTLATRAEAASGMAEAELALQSLRSRGGRAVPELAKGEDLLRMSTAEFNSQNFGGALYLATEAKSLARQGEERLGGGPRGALRPGEVAFAVPVPLRVVTTGNVREGPGMSFGVVFTVRSGTVVTGYSYADDWVRVTDPEGRSGWIYHNLLASRQGGSR